MSDFVTQLKLAEKAAEDIYFARVNRKLIESIHKRMQAQQESQQPCEQTVAGQERMAVGAYEKG